MVGALLHQFLKVCQGTRRWHCSATKVARHCQSSGTTIAFGNARLPTAADMSSSKLHSDWLHAWFKHPFSHWLHCWISSLIGLLEAYHLGSRNFRARLLGSAKNAFFLDDHRGRLDAKLHEDLQKDAVSPPPFAPRRSVDWLHTLWCPSHWNDFFDVLSLQPVGSQKNIGLMHLANKLRDNNNVNMS